WPGASQLRGAGDARPPPRTRHLRHRSPGHGAPRLQLAVPADAAHRRGARGAEPSRSSRRESLAAPVGSTDRSAILDLAPKASRNRLLAGYLGHRLAVTPLTQGAPDGNGIEAQHLAHTQEGEGPRPVPAA